MAVKVRVSGDLDYKDDEPVLCDCGCIVEAGADYHTYTFKVWDTVANEVVPMSLTYCGYEECLGKLLMECLEGYAVDTEEHVNSATDEADKYYDYLSDRDWQDVD